MSENTLPPFVFYSGAYLPRNYSQLGAWVKYRKGPDKVEQIGKGPGWLHISAPDRELLIIRNSNTTGPARPLDMDWDEFVPFSLCNTISSEMSVDRYMINYLQHVSLPKGKGRSKALARANPRKSTNLRIPGSLVRDGKTIQSDSGGFQLLSGKASWIDPVDLAKWYSVNCDEGITLDVPVSEHLDDREILIRSANVQVHNNKIIMDIIPESFRLFNVLHGLKHDNGRKFREIIEKDGPDGGLCIPLYYGNVLRSVAQLVSIISDTDFKTYDRYHILGVYNLAMLIPIIRYAALMRKAGKNFTISSDASTAEKSASTRTMHLQRAHYKNAERLALGQSAIVVCGPKENPQRWLPCSCPVCQTFKYVDIISHCKSSMVAHSFIIHNMIEIDRWVKMMMNYAMELSAEEYSELVTSQLNGSPAIRSVRPTLRFVEIVAEEGIQKALKQFSHIMEDGILSYEPPDSTMFGEYDRSFTSIQSSADDEVLAEYNARVDTILTRYEEYHRQGDSPVISEKRARNKRVVKKVLVNSAIPKNSKLNRKTKKRKAVVQLKTGESTHSKKRITVAKPVKKKPQSSLLFSKKLKSRLIASSRNKKLSNKR